ncbi:Protein of unknown function [Selenomonas sp. GACV-9]|uniref:DUF4127 family protein n=1 Tax=Selenomonas sp. GACV-9 TaxID=3158782 RepID=UPI0008E08071|nr:Protein of unknown function [Selenomonas ruminantium]
MKIKAMVLSGLLITALQACSLGGVEAASKGRLVFIPHDNRPISCEDTADVARAAGYEVITPPQELLSGGVDKPGDPDKLWQWAKENVRGADAAMFSSDSMVYGGLVPSRKHELDEDTLAARVQEFAQLRQENPRLKLYVFDSIMRTPKSGMYSGNAEPAYYQPYGADIFQYSALADKKSLQGLTAAEEQALQQHEQAVPQEVWQDWRARRAKNLKVSEQLVDLTRQGVINYLVVGKDDNAPYSQTHHEGLLLEDYGKDLPDTRYQVLAGIDEFGALLLSRAVNDTEKEIPFIYVKYNKGKGADTVPGYSDTRIDNTIRASVRTAGGLVVNTPERADFVLLVNTNEDGRTGEANLVTAAKGTLANNGEDRGTAKYFTQQVNDYVAAGKAVGVADIAFANGADNALLKSLQAGGLLYKIRAYAGWNTPTNSTGFVIATGLLSSRMPDDACDNLLTKRYLDDWGYQANVRPQMATSIAGFRRWDVYSNMGSYETGIVNRINTLMREFAVKNLPPFANLDNLQVTLPWHRMFEANFKY